MYVETFEAAIGPVVVAQVVTAGTPVTAHTPTPTGELAPLGPVTVAVNVTVEPRVAVPELAVTATAGVVLLTVVVYPDVRADAK